MTDFSVPRRGCECSLCRKSRGLEPLSEGALAKRRLARMARKNKGRVPIEQLRPCSIENISEIERQ